MRVAANRQVLSKSFLVFGEDARLDSLDAMTTHIQVTHSTVKIHHVPTRANKANPFRQHEDMKTKIRSACSCQPPWLSTILLLSCLSLSRSFSTSFNIDQRQQYHDLAPPLLAALQSGNDGSSSQPTPTTPQEQILEWASALPEPVFVSPSIGVKVRPPAEGGAGLFAAADIGFNETLAVLPFDMSSSSGSSSDQNTKFPGFKFDAQTVMGLLNDGPVKERLSELLEEATRSKNTRRMASILAGAVAHLHLMKLRRVQQMGAEDDSSIDDPIDLFLDVLPMLPTKDPAPHPFPSHVLFWTDQQIEILLGGTLALTKARFMRAQAGEVVGLLSTAFLQEHCRTMSVIEITAAKDAMVSAFACVASRTFEGLNATDTTSSGSLMIPFVDLLNHMPADDRNVRHAVDDDRNAAILVSDREIEAGEEITINYGERQAWDWATKYGFVPSESVNASVEDDSEGDVTIALPIFPQILRKEDGSEVDMTTKGDDGLRALNAIRIAFESVDDQSTSDDLMLAELFLPEDESSSSPFPAKHGCVIVRGSTNGSFSAAESAKARARPLFACAEYISRQIQQGQSIDQDTASSFMIGLSGDVETKDVDEYMLHRAQERCEMLETGMQEAKKWTSTDQEGQDGYTDIRLRLAEQMREVELKSARKLLRR